VIDHSILLDNPLFQLGQEIVAGKYTLEQALDKAASTKFLTSVTQEHCLEIFDVELHNVYDHEPDLAFIFLSINAKCADKISIADGLRARIFHLYALKLIDKEYFAEAYSYLDKAKKIFSQEGAKHELANCDLNLGKALIGRRQYGRAISILESAQKSFTMDMGIQYFTECNQTMGRAHYLAGNYTKASELFHMASHSFDRTGDEDMATVCRFEMAHALYFAGADKWALEVLDEVLSSSKISENELLFAASHVLKADLAANGSILETLFHVFWPTRTIGEVCFLADEAFHSARPYKKALDYLESAKIIFHQLGEEQEVARCEQKMATIYGVLDDFGEAETLITSALKIFAKYEMFEQANRCFLYRMLAFESEGVWNPAGYQITFNNRLNLYRFDMLWRSFLRQTMYYKRKGQIERARISCQNTVNIIEYMTIAISSEVLRPILLSEAYEVYCEMVNICLEKNDVASAVVYIERAKTFFLSGLVNYRDAAPINASESESRRFQEIRHDIRKKSIKLGEIKDPAEKLVEKVKFDKDLRTKKYIIEKSEELTSGTNAIQDRAISLLEICALMDGKDAALVELFPMRDKTAVFVVHGSQSAVYYIPTMSYTVSDLVERATRLFQQYEAFRSTEGLLRLEARKQWLDLLELILKELYQELFQNISSCLYDKEGKQIVSKIIFIPFNSFHFLPLHAMFTDQKGKRRYLIDDFTVSYAPSVSILSKCYKRKRVNKNDILVAYANPEPTRDLLYAKNEAESLIDLFGDSLSHFSSRATKENIIELSREPSIFHYCGHADFEGLYLHGRSDGSECFGVKDIFKDLYLPNTYLATLSACESGITLPSGVDEFIGIPSAFLYAGAATVVSSLWPVSDISTNLLMRKMYDALREGKGKAESLREAQLWLKDPNMRKEHMELIGDIESNRRWLGTDQPIPDFSDPYYWAGFICSGAE
jgi:CHAT domain-containing protein